MAIKIQFQTKFGVGGEYVNFNPQISDKTKLSLRMKYWLDKATRDTEGSLPFNDQMNGRGDERIAGFNCNYQCDYDLDSPLNVYQQGYDFLKTLPEFADATDDLTADQSTQLQVVKTINITNLKKVGL